MAHWRAGIAEPGADPAGELCPGGDERACANPGSGGYQGADRGSRGNFGPGSDGCAGRD
jgi:hypothetical protein